tara:strand:+ start:444 stop:653 length:210 start_codon:yes stop_codon:yes gene_type:complete
MPSVNKDGTPRKKGSGRPKGASSFARVSFQELERICAGKPDHMVVVSRVWLEKEGFLRARELCKILNVN